MGLLDAYTAKPSASLRALMRPERALGARRLAMRIRAALAAVGLCLALADHSLSQHALLAATGFALILLVALIQLLAPRLSWQWGDELLGPVACLLIIGLEAEHVTALSVIWLAAIATGVIVRQGRVRRVARAGLIAMLAVPIITTGALSTSYAGLCVAAMALLATCVRVMRDLDHLLLQARHEADHDDLTGLLSRSAFRAALERAAGEAQPEAPVALLLIDLDGFGKVNKVHGHAAGDSVLAAAGNRLARAVDADCTVGRLGGDEFAIIVPGLGAMPVAQRLLKRLAAGDEHDDRPVSGCIGIAHAPRYGSDADALLMATDIALRVAKRSRNGGQISVYRGVSLSGSGHRSARYAISRLINGEGLSIAVQPILDLSSGAVHAYEALARFQGDGSESPLHWFSIAEELGMREELEHACLRAALRLLRHKPRHARLSVNLSAPVLLEPSTLATIERESDLTHLIIEVTEDALVASAARLRRELAPLRERGVRIAVDDMGAGYSGLRQVTSVRPHYLKLDRSLIDGVDLSPDQAALVGALCLYAKKLDSLLVAKGVETAAELRTLIELGVPLAQGFHLAAPGPPWPRPRLLQATESRARMPLDLAEVEVVLGAASAASA